MRIRSIAALFAMAAIFGILSGCSSIGPKTVLTDSFDYTGVLADSWKQRMLLNMVRIRYGDTPYFLEVASVINQYSLETGVNLSGQLARTGAGDTFVGIGGHGTYTDRPTITYLPLSGEKFARSLMRPLPPSAVMGMIEAGYSIELVIRCCVESVNGVKNRSGGLLRYRPADDEFYPLLERLERIQKTGAIGLRVQKERDSETTVLSIRGRADQSVLADSLFVRKTLGLNLEAEEFRVVYGSMAKDDRELAILTRSLLQIINNLASNIEVPDAHVAENIVNPTAREVTPAGTPEPPLIRIRSSSSRPENAFVAIPYQSYWFWIDNRDLRSKGFFSFLMFLFSLTETSGKEGAPVVTISAGG
jgi:hypothetical protein